MKVKSFLLYITWLCHCVWMTDTLSSATFSSTTVGLSDTDFVIVNSDVSSSNLHSSVSEMISSSVSVLGTNPVDVQTSFSSASDLFSAEMSTYTVEGTATNTPSLASIALILSNFVTSSSNSDSLFETDIIKSSSSIDSIFDTGIVTSSGNNGFIFNTDTVTSNENNDFFFNTGTITSSRNSDFIFNTGTITSSRNNDFTANTANSKSGFFFYTDISSGNSDFILNTYTASSNSDSIFDIVTSSANSVFILNTDTATSDSDSIFDIVTSRGNSNFILNTDTENSSSDSVLNALKSNRVSAPNIDTFATGSDVTNFYPNSDLNSNDILVSNSFFRTDLTSSSTIESLTGKKTEPLSTLVSIVYSTSTSAVVSTVIDGLASSVSVVNIIPTRTSDAVLVSDRSSYLSTNLQTKELNSSFTDNFIQPLQSISNGQSFEPSLASFFSNANTESIFSTTLYPSFYDVSTKSGLTSSAASSSTSSQFSTTFSENEESAIISGIPIYNDNNQTATVTGISTGFLSFIPSSLEMEKTETMKTSIHPSQSTYQITRFVDSLMSSISYQASAPISTSLSTHHSTYKSNNQASALSNIIDSLDATSEIMLNSTRTQVSQSLEYAISFYESDGSYTSYVISSDQLPVLPIQVSTATQTQQELNKTATSSHIEGTSIIHASAAEPNEYTSYMIDNSLLTNAFPYISTSSSIRDTSSKMIEIHENDSVPSLNFYASTPRSTSLNQQISELFTDLVSSNLSTIMSTQAILPSTSIQGNMQQSSPSVLLDTSSESYTNMSSSGLSSMTLIPSEILITQNSKQESYIRTSSNGSSIFIAGTEHMSKVPLPISRSTNIPLSTVRYLATTEVIQLTDTLLLSIFTNQQAVSTSSTNSFVQDFTSYPIITYPTRSTSLFGIETSYSDVISGLKTETTPFYFTMAPSATVSHLKSPTEMLSVYKNLSTTYSDLYSLQHTITFPSQSENKTVSLTTTRILTGSPIFTSDNFESYSESMSEVHPIILSSSSDILRSTAISDLESSSESLLSFYYDLLTTTMFSDLLTSSSKLPSPDITLDTRSDSNSVSTSSTVFIIPNVESSTRLIQLFPSTQHLVSQASSFSPSSLFSVIDSSRTSVDSLSDFLDSTIFVVSHISGNIYQTIPSSTLELLLPTPSVSLPKESSGIFNLTIESIQSPTLSTFVTVTTSPATVSSELTPIDISKTLINSSYESYIVVITSESLPEQSSPKYSMSTVPTFILGSEPLFKTSSVPTYTDSTTMKRTVDLSLLTTTDLLAVKESSSVESLVSFLTPVEVSTVSMVYSSIRSSSHTLTSTISTSGEVSESTMKVSTVPSTIEVESVIDSFVVSKSSVVVSTNSVVESLPFVASTFEISVESTSASSVVSPSSSGSTDESISDLVDLASLSVVDSASESSVLALSSVEPSTTGMVSSPELHTTDLSKLPSISIVSSPVKPVASTLSYTVTDLSLVITSVSLTQPQTNLIPSFSVISSVVDLISPTLESSPEISTKSNKEASRSPTDVVSMLQSDAPILTTGVIQPSQDIISSSSLTTITDSSLESSNRSLTDLSSDYIQSSSISPVESTIAMNSSTMEPPTSTDGLNTSSALEDFWIKTVLKIRKSVDIESSEFKNNLEIKLVEAYSEAYKRQEEIDNGVYEPLLRRKRMASSTDINLQIINITRVDNSNNVDVVYILQQNGVYVPAATATEKLNLFSDQELALRLGYVVDKNAVPYNEPVVNPTATEDRKLWIIGAVLGPIAAFLFIWFILCCVYRCCKRTAQEENKHKASEPHLVMVKRADRNGEREHLDIQVIHNHHEPDYVEEPVEKGTGPSILQSTKRGLYEVNHHPDEEEAPVQHKPSPKHKTPIKKSLTKEDIQMVSEADTVTYISEGDLTASRPPKPKTRKSKAKKIEENLYGEDSMTEQEAMEDKAYHTHPLPHDFNDEELIQKAALERKRNKQRLREKRRTDGQGHISQTHNSDIENVLDSSHDKPLPDIFIHKPRKRPTKPKRNKPHSHMNQGYSDDDNSEVAKAPETIQEARKRMHQLLDDAFSLLSSSTSSIGSHSSKSSRSRIPRNKVNPAPQEEDKNYKPHTKPRSKKSNSTEKNTEEKSESPVYVNRTYNSHDEAPVIETWSPYRAGDEVARISLPQTQAIKDKTPRQNQVNTTTFSENLQTSLRDNYYTTEPAKPIVIKTMGLDSNGFKVNGISHRSSAMPNGGMSYPGIQGFDAIPSTRLNMYDNVNDDNIEMVTLTGHGHANQFEHRPYQAWREEDEMDVIKNSIQPGVSPSPLIESIRDELNILSRRNQANKHNNIHIANGGDVSV